MSGKTDPRAAKAAALGSLVSDFCWRYAPTHLTTSEGTLANYRTALRLYVGWLSEERGVTPLTLSADDFSPSSIEGWLAWLADARGNKPQTRAVRLESLRTFLTYASTHDPTFAGLAPAAMAVAKPRGPKTKVSGMPREAVAALAAAPDQSTASGRRDLAVIMTLYATACRVGELLGMRVRDLALDAPSPHVTVTGKGNKSRVLHLPEKAAAALRRHVAETLGEDPDPDHYVFWSRNHPRGTHPLSDDAVTKLLRKHAKAAREACPDVPPKLHAHVLRHARASNWLDDGSSVAQVSLLLGHSSIQTTMDYLDISPDAKEEAMAPIVGESQPKRWKGGCARTLLAHCGF